mgnify:CR=1 FL=1|jgi:hypothetical protein
MQNLKTIPLSNFTDVQLDKMPEYYEDSVVTQDAPQCSCGQKYVDGYVAFAHNGQEGKMLGCFCISCNTSIQLDRNGNRKCVTTK